MRGRPLIRDLRFDNLLSFGPRGVVVEVQPLNVLIGPNASGKSNLLEALAVLRASATDLGTAIREGGGVEEYLWKGAKVTEVAQLTAHIGEERGSVGTVHFSIGLTKAGSRVLVDNERILRLADTGHIAGPVYVMHGGEAKLRTTPENSDPGLRRVTVKPDQSVLSQFREPELYPELTVLAELFGAIALFQEWNFGRGAPSRRPQPTDLPNDFLLPDASNLGLILHDVGQTSARRDELIDYLRRFYDRARHISTKIQGGTLQLYIEEEGGRLIPATRLSDGTLRYLCLLAILLHPNPPPVIGIEEPELGLHPDILPTIAELLRKASERTQLFVTTHSDTLVSALSDTPECILVCESTPDGTTMKRLEAEPLREWLEKYSLGEIWRMGEIGGNRW